MNDIKSDRFPSPELSPEKFENTSEENPSSDVEQVGSGKADQVDPSTNSADRILLAALDPKTVRRSLRPVSRLDLNSSSKTVSPSDIGDHKPIPEEAICMSFILSGEKIK